MSFHEYIRLLKELQNCPMEEDFSNLSGLYTFAEKLESQIFYQQRHDYFKLIEQFATDKSMSSSQFTKKFYDFYLRDQAKVEHLKQNWDQLTTIEYNKRAENFSSIISIILQMDDHLLDVSSLDDPHPEQREEMYRDWVIHIYHQIKPEWPEWENLDL